MCSFVGCAGSVALARRVFVSLLVLSRVLSVCLSVSALVYAPDGNDILS